MSEKNKAKEKKTVKSIEEKHRKGNKQIKKKKKKILNIRIYKCNRVLMLFFCLPKMRKKLKKHNKAKRGSAV